MNTYETQRTDFRSQRWRVTGFTTDNSESDCTINVLLNAQYGYRINYYATQRILQQLSKYKIK